MKYYVGGVFVIVENMPRAVKFYRDILDLPGDEEFVNNSPEDIRTIYSIELGETPLILDSIHLGELKPSENHLFMFDTEDIYASYESMKEKGVNLISEVVESGDIKFFELLDSEGNKLMFCEEIKK